MLVDLSLNGISSTFDSLTFISKFSLYFKVCQKGLKQYLVDEKY